jgi:hypothetical protein
MKLNLDRVISIATLASLLVAIVLLLKRPAPVALAPPSVGVQSSSTQSSSQPSSQRADQPDAAAKQAQQPQTPAGNSATSSATPQLRQNSPARQSAEAHINSDAVSAAINKLLGASGAGLSPDANVGDGLPNIKDQKVTYDGDTVHGQFLTEIGGKDVWITISGHMGQKDGYATFDPTEFKVGDVEVPVALVNPALQQKLAEERDRLKVTEPAK